MTRWITIIVLGLAAIIGATVKAANDDASDNAATNTSSPAAAVTDTAAATPVAPKKWGPFYSPLDPKNWQLNFQTTYIWQRKPPLNAKYTGPHSLLTKAETGYTLTGTVFLGFRPWIGAEIFFNPEVIQNQDISNLYGLAGVTNGEEQRGGGPTPDLYKARLFLRQTFSLGGSSSSVEAGPNQFAGAVSSRRLVLTIGNLAVTDIFDANAYSHDPRTSFLNWAIWTYGASDFAADARGYTVGLAIEYYHDDWAFRIGRFAQPKQSNGLQLDYNIIIHFGDVFEVEHDHVICGMPGAIRFDFFHNRARMGGYRDALKEAAQSGGIPSVANVREDRSKLIFGINLEQALTRDLGVFMRFSYSDGQSEEYAYAQIDLSFVFGATMKGTLWLRPKDTFGLAYVVNGISDADRDYLAAGGLGYFIGDGRLSYGMEQILEAYYALKVFNGLWFTLDGQFIVNPAYNRDRGPATFFGCRFHVEF